MNINATPITCGVGPLGYVLGTYKSDDVRSANMHPEQIKAAIRCGLACTARPRHQL